MNNVVIEGGSSSECSSGCESGWTLYLEHSNSKFSISGCNKRGKICPYGSKNKQQKIACFDENDDVQDRKNGGCSFDNSDEEEDLSMVSDASSGPPHFDHDVDDVNDDDDEVHYSGKKRNSMRLLTTTTPHHQCFKADDFALDDTASSPNFISKNNSGENQVCSLKRVIDYSSQGFSGTHINQGRSKNFQEHYGFIQPKLAPRQY